MIKLPACRRALSSALLLSLLLVAGPQAFSTETTPAAAATAAERAFTRGDPVPVWIDRIAATPAAASGHALSIGLADLHFRAGEGIEP